MSDRTHIQWTDASWNPIRAGLVNFDTKHVDRLGWQCQRVSPGCQNCYAEAINNRLGTGLAYDAKGMAASEPLLDEKTLVQPLSWRKPRRVFVCSMTDIAGEWVPDEWLDRMFAVMALTPQHEYQVLTKRPKRLREYLTAARGTWEGGAAQRIQRLVDENWPASSKPSMPWPLPNVWLGTSVEDQERADERIPELLATPAAVRFLSCEPLLGPVDLTRLDLSTLPPHPHNPIVELNAFTGLVSGMDEYIFGRVGLDWVVIGGESGPRARPMDLAWARSLVQQCKAAGVAVFVKQLGAQPYVLPAASLTGPEAKLIGALTDSEGHLRFHLRDRKGGDPDEWPEDLRVREWPKEGVIA